MEKSFKMTRAMKYGTLLLAGFLKLGIPLGPLRLLSVRGRKSGKVYTTPVALVQQANQIWLVAAFGEVGWVRNIRASGQAELDNGRTVEKIDVVEIDHQSAAPILKEFLKRFGMVPFIPPYFDVTRDSSLAEFEKEAQSHPVFQVVNSQSSRV